MGEERSRYVVRFEPGSVLYGLPTAVTYDDPVMAQQAAEALRRSSTWGVVTVETLDGRPSPAQD